MCICILSVVNIDTQLEITHCLFELLFEFRERFCLHSYHHGRLLPHEQDETEDIMNGELAPDEAMLSYSLVLQQYSKFLL